MKTVTFNRIAEKFVRKLLTFWKSQSFYSQTFNTIH